MRSREEELAQWLRVQIAFAEDEVSFPAPTACGSRLPVTPLTQDLTPRSGYVKCMHACMYAYEYVCIYLSVYMSVCLYVCIYRQTDR